MGRGRAWKEAQEKGKKQREGQRKGQRHRTQVQHEEAPGKIQGEKD